MLLFLGEQEFQVDVSARFVVSHDGTLTISNVQSEDGSTYMCRVRNGVGLKHYSEMYYEILVVAASWLCVVYSNVTRGQTPLTFKWYKNGKLLKNYSKEANSNEKFSTLVLDPVTASSSGNYTCVVSNSHGQSSYSTILVVRCDVRNQTLEHLNKPHNNVNGTLTLHPVIKEHEGVYICEVNNDVGETLMKQATVVVHDAPEIKTISLCSDGGDPQKASVACILKQGQTPMEFKWLKDNNRLHESKNLLPGGLLLEPSDLEDGGETASLICVADGQPPQIHWKQVDIRAIRKLVTGDAKRGNLTPPRPQRPTPAGPRLRGGKHGVRRSAAQKPLI
ncbi:titin [Caerostris extrusa]|uniref:Titin n=1 Tax=Caerostris extrusa TaxID=172846 RepID=A0AAV4Y0S3_CAEEX|nr:titin [Caerostris extrusa]